MVDGRPNSMFDLCVLSLDLLDLTWSRPGSDLEPGPGSELDVLIEHGGPPCVLPLAVHLKFVLVDK